MGSITKVLCFMMCMMVVSFSFAQESSNSTRGEVIEHEEKSIAPKTEDSPGAKKKLGLSVSVGYSPGLFIDSRYIGSSFSPLGFSVRVTYILLKESYGHFGVELACSWLGLEKEKENGYNLITHAVPLNVNFVYQYPFNDRLKLNSHLGVGLNFINLQYDYGNNDVSPSLTELGFSADIGVGLQVAIIKGFYAEIGIEYIITVAKKVITQMLMPSLLVGYEF